MRHGNRDVGSRQTLHEDGRAVGYLDQRQPRLVFLGLVARETRPMLCTWNHARKRRHHLAAIAHPERKHIRPGEERRKLIRKLRIEPYRARPAFARAQPVPVTEASYS